MRAHPATVGLSLAAIACLALSGCTSGNPAQPQTSGQQGGSSSASPAPKAELAAVDDNLLEHKQGTFKGEGIQVTSWTIGHQTPGIAFGLDALRGHILRNRVQTGDSSALTMQTHLSAASSKAAGVVLSAKGDKGTNVAMVWYDPQTNATGASPMLVDPGKWGDFVKAAAAKSSDAAAATKQLGDQSWPMGTGPALGFTKEGALVVHFQVVDGKQLAPVLIEAKSAEALLSPFGIKARAATQYPTKVSTPSQFGKPAQMAGQGRPTTMLGQDCTTKKCVALTFDDGPVPETRGLVQTLTRLKVPATFFELGDSLEADKGETGYVFANGHEVASHNYHHNQMSHYGDEKLNHEIEKNNQILTDRTGVQPLFLRPPYGDRSKRVNATLGRHGMISVIWNIDTEDWRHSSDSPETAQSAILANIAKEARPGSIMLMHDIHANSRAAVPAVVKQLTDDGYTFVSLSELNDPSMFRFGTSLCTSLNQKGALC